MLSNPGGLRIDLCWLVTTPKKITFTYRDKNLEREIILIVDAVVVVIKRSSKIPLGARLGLP